jgi:hypothetical protein
MGYAQGQNTVSTANIIDSAVTTAKVNDDAITLAKMASGTDGNLITYDASGDPAAVATGTSGQVLTSGGAGVAPTMQTLATGTVVAIKKASTSTYTGTTGTTFVDVTDMTITHTAADSANRIQLVFSGVMGGSSTSSSQFRPEFQLLDDSTQVALSSTNFIAALDGGNLVNTYCGSIMADVLPGDTASHTYKLQLRCSNAAASISARIGNSTTTHSVLMLTEYTP